ncbi:hypothetical protein VIGAN_10118900 [Vigna angularis var. angularis]|uniref:Uncharacterized protein n=1 Tax=Vigna angularis var. angularis TaxID=157739 RepID=A0A0S3T3S2_PHAAN|nr:hypothetical protein VIGAN_10118900 [Vigna angularis var. angularis]
MVFADGSAVILVVAIWGFLCFWIFSLQVREKYEGIWVSMEFAIWMYELEIPIRVHGFAFWYALLVGVHGDEVRVTCDEVAYAHSCIRMA